uniref:Uncharacterized protein n=1 Tax=Setaria viridis TaxID=4556 RepID=A0A4V6Y871_SETVI|nr:hypothetical protein SEVIR_6G131900v2 [Setaria viridis]
MLLRDARGSPHRLIIIIWIGRACPATFGRGPSLLPPLHRPRKQLGHVTGLRRPNKQPGHVTGLAEKGKKSPASPRSPLPLPHHGTTALGALRPGNHCHFPATRPRPSPLRRPPPALTYRPLHRRSLTPQIHPPPHPLWPLLTGPPPHASLSVPQIRCHSPPPPTLPLPADPPAATPSLASPLSSLGSSRGAATAASELPRGQQSVGQGRLPHPAYERCDVGRPQSLSLSVSAMTRGGAASLHLPASSTGWGRLPRWPPSSTA